jgi:C4-dicarboxylate-binding protein DctP
MTKGLDLGDPERLRNKTVRVFSTTMASMIDGCGGTPKVMSITKVHDALRDGAIEVVVTGVVAVETRNLWKVVDTITRTDHASIEFLVIINEKVWQGLTDRQRTIVLAAAKNSEREARQRSSEIEERTYRFARSKGMTVRELTPDQVAAWRACSADTLAAYMNSGGELVRRLLGAYGRLRTDPCCNAGPMGTFSQR